MLNTTIENQRPYQICTKTVMDITDPTITFDHDGISNHFWEFNNFVKQHWHTGPEGRLKLEQMVEVIKKSGEGHEFDCIMGLSGGADSSYMLHVMVTEFGLRPLVFHVDGGWNTELAVHNIKVLVDSLGLDLFTEVINWKEMRDFQLAMFKSGLPNIDGPQDIAFIGVLYQYAQKYGIKFILNGGNISTECVCYPLQYYYYADMTLVRDVLSRFGLVKMATYPFSSIFYRKFYLPYFQGVKIFKPLNFVPYIKAEAMIELEKVYGWKPYPQKHFESIFTRFFEGYWLPTRFGFDVRRVQFSSLILTEQMDRGKALELLEVPPYDTERIQQEIEYVAAKLGISEAKLHSYHQMPKNFYWNYRNKCRRIQLGEKIMSKISGTRRGGAF
ncbi:N-acetyl sugar amidotransferase [Desulfocicer vacuolatum DSM 3385]|uniref:N-acetyl sugar amidotransferase n=1 Tax=Desulfocicer vacuolatum DSM 3385 TaxID=1121400 RepID=A0A1W1Z4J2_9BACT|nr:N-acetyl sugar amidotransferase [Desulfocicer vacuolatum]SMC43390.1 N-acetyl sugar amidotransferase [Desulfocicer vacuolatum DSM 3385]